MAEGLPIVNAKEFQHPLEKLAETVAQKVKREGPSRITGPPYIADDMYTMMRQAMATYRVLFYLNADERREKDIYWRIEYGIVTSPIIRSMIDCLYNVASILEHPGAKGSAYHRSGLNRLVLDTKEDEERYRGRPEWDAYSAERLEAVRFLLRMNKMTEADLEGTPTWPTLGKYLRNAPDTPLKQFLRNFTYMHWRQYSALSHGAYEGFLFGYVPAGAYFTIDSLPHDARPVIEKKYDLFVSEHLSRTATVLLCLVTEVQGYFRFLGADINERIEKMWAVLMPAFSAKEAYDARYRELMKERGIIKPE